MSELHQLARKFQIDGMVTDVAPHGNGHIHDTFVVTCRNSAGDKVRYLLQRVNTYVFQNPEEVMANIQAVTDYLKEKIRMQGGDPERETLTVIPTIDGDLLYKSDDDSYRMYRFIEGTESREEVEDQDDAYAMAYAYGHMQEQLQDFPAETLYETIPDFHNTPKRFRQLQEAVAKDACRRAKHAMKEIMFAEARADQYDDICRALRHHEIPLRVTHNDAKINNLLRDPLYGEGICIVDLDTVMPGSLLYDFGDMVRSTMVAREKAGLEGFDYDLYESLETGFCDGCYESITLAEQSLFLTGAWMMTMECGIRFLTDYLEGDVYFKTNSETHNLERAWLHFRVAAQIEEYK